MVSETLTATELEVPTATLRAVETPRTQRKTNHHEVATTWSELRPVARHYLGVVITLGAVAIVLSMPRAMDRGVSLFAALAILSLIASAIKVTLPGPRSVSTLTVCYVLDFTTLLLLGPPAATL